MFGWLADGVCVVGWFFGWLMGGVIGWIVGWLIGYLVGIFIINQLQIGWLVV